MYLLLLELILHTYVNQSMGVTLSSSFSKYNFVMNNVKQGGILPPLSLNVYIKEFCSLWIMMYNFLYFIRTVVQKHNGCQLWNNEGSYCAWRKMLRHMWNLPGNTPSRVIPSMLKTKPSCWIYIRDCCTKFTHSCVNRYDVVRNICLSGL